MISRIGQNDIDGQVPDFSIPVGEARACGADGGEEEYRLPQVGEGILKSGFVWFGPGRGGGGGGRGGVRKRRPIRLRLSFDLGGGRGRV